MSKHENVVFYKLLTMKYVIVMTSIIRHNNATVNKFKKIKSVSS